MKIDILAEGLAFPEGPVALADGSVLVVEIAAGRLTRVRPDGLREVVADVGGGPNGAAIGPDGACYVCDGGGYEWHRHEDGTLHPGLQPAGYAGGRIVRVDLASGEARTLYTHSDKAPLKGPNDLVFDADGGLWFSDLGKRRARDMDHGAICWARADGSECREVIHPMTTPNGVGLSPDGRRLYVAETGPGRLWAFDIAGPGRIARAPDSPAPHGGTLVAGLPGYRMFDSLAVEADGRICVATLHDGGITVVSPSGDAVEHVPMPDRFATNLCFGGAGMRTAFVTLSSTGRLAAVAWPRPGLPPNFHHRDGL